LCLIYPLYERVQKLFFLGSHAKNLRRLAIAAVCRASQ
jgi:hypothetical protein